MVKQNYEKIGIILSVVIIIFGGAFIKLNKKPAIKTNLFLYPQLCSDYLKDFYYDLNEVSLFIQSQYVEDEEMAWFSYVGTKNVNQDKVLTMADCAFTYYGIVLADIFQIKINLEKIRNTLYNAFIYTLVNSSVYDEYISDVYYTFLILSYLNDKCDNNITNIICSKMDVIIEQLKPNGELSSDLRNILFYSDIYNYLDKKNECTKRICTEYIMEAIENRKCVNTVNISLLELFFQNNDAVRPQKLEEQMVETVNNLYLSGGYKVNVLSNDADILSTSKFVLMNAFYEKEKLKAWLIDVYQNGICKIYGNDQVDLRILNEMIFLWGKAIT